LGTLPTAFAGIEWYECPLSTSENPRWEERNRLLDIAGDELGGPSLGLQTKRSRGKTRWELARTEP